MEMTYLSSYFLINLNLIKYLKLIKKNKKK